MINEITVVIAAVISAGICCWSESTNRFNKRTTIVTIAPATPVAVTFLIGAELVCLYEGESLSIIIPKKIWFISVSSLNDSLANSEYSCAYLSTDAVAYLFDCFLDSHFKTQY